MKNTKIIYFNNLTHYKISGGVNHLKWDVKHAYFIILLSKGFLKLFFNSNDAKIFSASKKTYVLIAFGFFSVDYKKLTVNESKVISTNLKLGKKRNSKIQVVQISKPKKIKNTVVGSFSNATLKNNNINLKSIQP
tara:strand:- start:1392 stop:1796 length:405 start_codon:yes stop_codon:yes gene_type:complete